MDLIGKAVIVTGSSSGIGAAVARRLSGLGAGIVVNSASSAEAGQRVAAEACLALITTKYATGQTLLVDGGLGLVI